MVIGSDRTCMCDWVMMTETNWHIHEEGRGALQTEREGISASALWSNI